VLPIPLVRDFNEMRAGAWPFPFELQLRRSRESPGSAALGDLAAKQERLWIAVVGAPPCVRLESRLEALMFLCQKRASSELRLRLSY
jgi:hypothetical protein